MTRRQWILIGVGGATVLVAGFAIGFAFFSGRSPSSTPTPSPSSPAEFSCEVSLEPTTLVVDLDRLDVAPTMFIAGTGFPSNSGVTLLLTGATADFVSDASGSFTYTFAAVSGETYPAPPDLEAGPLTWTVIGWDAPEAPGDFASIPPRVCETPVTVTIELTHAPSPTPPTDLSAGGYAEILADGVRVRVEPSLKATVVGALFTGDVVRILAPAQVVEGLAWYRIESVVTQSGEQVRGYIAAGADGQVYLRPTVEPPPTPTPGPSPSPSPSPT